MYIKQGDFTTTEDRIREQLNLQLSTKDKTIADMQNKLQNDVDILEFYKNQWKNNRFYMY